MSARKKKYFKENIFVMSEQVSDTEYTVIENLNLLLSFIEDIERNIERIEKRLNKLEEP